MIENTDRRPPECAPAKRSRGGAGSDGPGAPGELFTSLFLRGRERLDATSEAGQEPLASMVEERIPGANEAAVAEGGEVGIPGANPAVRRSRTAHRAEPETGGFDVRPPPTPRTLAETGLTLAQLSDLVLKLIYLHGSLTGGEVSRQVVLPFSVVLESLIFLRQVRCLEVQSGESVGHVSYRFLLTEEGRTRAREAFEHSRYVGPAPVSLRSYIDQCRRQTVAGIPCTAESLRPAFEGLVLRNGLLDELGPAVCDGQAIFLHGPPGNGKTVLARRLGRFLNQFGGEIYVPYAVQADGAIIVVFDPHVHQTTDDAERPMASSAAVSAAELTARTAVREPSGAADATPSKTAYDWRWRRIRRPVVVTAGELTLEMLDLCYHSESGYYAAPMHVKANGGVFLIDDFGRQLVSPRELLNRWILPLAERIDYLTLVTGKKFAVPFEQLVIFSTNLAPAELVDDAFLRRIRHKIPVGPPTSDEFAEVLRRCCTTAGVPLDADAERCLFESRYSLHKPPRWSDPHDLLEIARSICRFRGEEPRLTRDLMLAAARRFFCDV